MREQEIYIEAIAREAPDEREKYLDEACKGDPELRQRVEKLLQQSNQIGSFLEHPPVKAMESAVNGLRSEIDATLLHQGGSTVDGDKDTSMEHPFRSRLEHEDEEIPLGYLLPSTDPDSLGRLGHYEILEVVGRGAFGTVLRAFDEKLQRVVAIKVLAPEMAATSPARKRFLREARASAAVRHENVVAIYAVEDQPLPYLVMEYIPGKTLQQRLDEQGPLDLSHVLRLGKQIADGLAAAHAVDLIHRDVKPGNILLEGGLDDRVKITDFGLARAADDASMTQSGVIAGTPLYMAPEQALGRKLDQRADLFSLGSVLYQMISGRPPFRAPNTLAVLKRVTEDTPRPIQEILPETPEWLCDLIGHLHAKNPDERYGTAEEVSKLLAGCQAEVEAGRIPTIPPPGHVDEQGLQGSALPVVPERQRLWQRTIVKVAAVLILLSGTVSLIATKYRGSDKIVTDITEETNETSGFPPDSIAYKLTSDEYKWTDPEQVVIGGDRHMAITNPLLSSDGQSLYFASPSKPAVGSEDLFVSQRSADGESWDPPIPLPTPINSPFPDGGPSVSADGRTLFFHSHRPGGEGDGDLWIATRDALDEPFGNVKNLGSNVNGQGEDVDPELSADGLTLVFISDRNGSRDTWISNRKTISDPFGVPLNPGAPVNSAEVEIAPTLSRDGTALLFSSNRAGNYQIWMSLRATQQEPFGTTKLVDLPYGRFAALHPFLSADGSELYYTIKRDQSLTLWRTRRVPRGAADNQQPVPVARPEPIQWSSDAPPLAIAPFDDKQAKRHQQAWAEYLGVPEEKQVLLGGKDQDGLDVKLTMVLIPPGEFLMGSSATEIKKFREQAQANDIPFRALKWIELEGPQRPVQISRPFYMSNTEITNDQFRSFVDATGFETEAEKSGKGSWTMKAGRMVRDPNINWRTQQGTGPTSPVTHVTWNDANAYCRWLAKQDGDVNFALPTEAQWEYACRAGTTTAWSCGDDESELVEYANVNMRWYRWCGSKKPNAFGLYDMHGNVWEWCRDSIYNYGDSEAVDPIGPDESKKIIRGGNVFGRHGGWHNSNGCRSAVRYEASAAHSVMDKGVRVVAEISEDVLQSKLSRVAPTDAGNDAD